MGDRQLSFFDTDKRLAALSAKGDPLEAIARLVPWESFREDIEAVLTLFDQHLETNGSIARGGQIVDATIVQVPRLPALCRRFEERQRTGNLKTRLCEAGRSEPARQFIRGPAGAEDRVPWPHDETLPQAPPATDHGPNDASTPAQAASNLADGDIRMRHAVKAPIGEEEIDAAICKWHTLCVAFDEVDLGQSKRTRPLASSLQHERRRAPAPGSEVCDGAKVLRTPRRPHRAHLR